MNTRHGTPEPIEDYLDELLSCLRLPPRATRRLLAETEDHLREAADTAVRRGATMAAAEREAIRQFGPPARIAAAASAARRPGITDTAVALAWAGVTLTGIGLAAVGASGIVAAVFNALVGRRFVGALPISYSNATCHRLLALHPASPNCSAAAILENSGDAVVLRLAAGVLGLGLLAVAWWARRHLSNDTSTQRLLDGAVLATASLAFGLASALLAGATLDTLIQHGSPGVGWSLSGVIVTACGAAGAATACWRRLRVLRPWRHIEPSSWPVPD